MKECKLVANSVNFLIGKREPGNTCEPLEGGLARNQPPQLQWLALVGPQLGKRGSRHDHRIKFERGKDTDKDKHKFRDKDKDQPPQLQWWDR